MVTLIAVLSTNAVSGLIKKLVQKFGPTEVRIMVLCVAALIVCGIDLTHTFPSLQVLAVQIGSIFTAAIAMYHVILKPINDSLNEVTIPPVDSTQQQR